MSKEPCWDGKCPYGVPLCCFECDENEYCVEICTQYDSCRGGEDEE